MKSSDIIPAIRTDHDALSIEIGELENEQKGPGYWKMNCSLLKDEEYVNSVAEMLPVWTAEGRKELSDSRNVWDWIKYNIRAHAINYSKKKAKERNATESNLQDELIKAKQEYETMPSDSNATRLNAAQEKLETFYEEKTKGIIIRARARWHEHGEKSTKYFLNLEKRNHIHLIPKLSILLFSCKLALIASLLTRNSKEYFPLNEAARANLQGNKRILKWRPFWNKVYKKAYTKTSHKRSN